MYRPNIKQVILHYIIHLFCDHLGCLSLRILIGTQNILPVRYTQPWPSVNIYAPLFTLYDRIRTLNSSYSHLVLSTLCWRWTLLIVVQYSGTSFKEEGLGPTTSRVAGGRRPINWGSAVSEVKWQYSANYPQTEDQARTDQDDYLCCSLRRFQPHRKEGWWWESLFSPERQTSL